MLIDRLPRALAENYAWQQHGRCRDYPHLFFTPDGERGRWRTTRELKAKAVCMGCPVMDMCQNYALTVGEPYGVWGGMTEDDRQLAG